MPTNLVLIGPPGVGKGTQAALLVERLGLLHLASGDIFRSEIAAGTELGTIAKAYIDRGELVPDEVTIGMMGDRFTGEIAQKRGFVLDGFPRTVAQADALDRKLQSLGIQITRVVSFDIDDEVVVERLSGRRICPNCRQIYHIRTKPPIAEGQCDNCGAALQIRADDNPDTIRNRLEVFHERSEPVLAYYREQGRLKEVDADRSTEDVYANVVEGLAV